MKRSKIILLLLSLMLTANLFCVNVNAADGYDYTDSHSLAEKLNEIFSGDIDLYSNSGLTKETIVPLEDRVNNDTLYYIKSKINGNTLAGWQCYIYANAVYNKLFGEFVGHANNLSKSKIVISGGRKSVSYDLFKDAGVKCGAYMRTTRNSNGSYNGNVGHSIIILSYDKSGVSYLEGNGDGNGLVRICNRTWNDFNYSFFSSKSRRVCHVVQPTQSHYESLYDSYADTVMPISTKNVSLGTVSSKTAKITISCKYKNGNLKWTDGSSVCKNELISQEGNLYSFKITSKAAGNEVLKFYLYDAEGKLVATQKVSVTVTAPYLKSSSSGISLVLGEDNSDDVILSMGGNLPKKYHIGVDFDGDFAKLSWGNIEDKKLNVKITAKKAGNGVIMCNLINDEDGAVIASKKINLDVSLVKYTVSYSMNGIEKYDAPKSQNKLYSQNIQLSPFVPQNFECNVMIDDNIKSSSVVNKKFDCVFLGWNTKANGRGKDYKPLDMYEENQDAKLFAKWSLQTLNLQEPIRKGYYFLGWYDSEDVNFWGFPTGNEIAPNEKVKRDMDIYAMWSPFPLLKLKDMGIESEMIFLKNTFVMCCEKIQKISVVANCAKTLLSCF